MTMYLPIALIVLSNIFYNICSKSTPKDLDPFASLTVTYLVGAAVSAAMFFIFNRGGNLLSEYKHLNWSAWVLGVSIVGLEAGSIYMYKLGWNISNGHLVHSSILVICLFFIGILFYKEQITLTKVVGIVICMIGLFFVHR